MFRILIFAIAWSSVWAKPGGQINLTSFDLPDENTKEMSVNNLMPTASRPAPKIAAPVLYQGVRYQQDREGTPGKEPGAAYLAAIDPATGSLLWLLKIADAIHHSPGSPWEIDPVYFSALEADAQSNALLITTNTGNKYQVDVTGRQVRLIYDPADFIQADERQTWGGNPPPPPPAWK